MTLKDLLIKKGIQFEEIGIDNFKGITEKGTHWHMFISGGAYGFQVVLYIGDKFVSHCKWQTAFKKIKTM